MKTKEEIIAFVLEQMREKKITKSQLGEALGAKGLTQLKIQKANQFLNLKNQKISLPDVIVVAELLGVSQADILLKQTHASRFEDALSIASIDKKYLIPLLSDLGGRDPLVDDPDIPQWVILPFVSNAQKYVSFRVHDDSMEPLIRPNSVLFLDTRIHNYDLEDQIVLARTSKQRVLRRFRRNKKGGIAFYADNPRYEPAFFTPDDDLEVEGVVTHVLQSVK